VGDDPALVGKSLINPKVLGLTSNLEEIVSRHHVNRVVLAINERRGRMPLDALIEMRLRDGLTIQESASFYEQLTGKISLSTFRPSGLIFSWPLQKLQLYRQVRNLLDVALSCVGLVLALPLMTLTALAVKLESSGPILYRQERVGQHNKRFTI